MENEQVLSVLNEEHLERFLQKLMLHAKTRLDAVLDKIDGSSKTKSPLSEWAKSEKTYPLMCGFSQELFVYNLQDNGFKTNPFTSDAIKESPFSHCAATIPVHLSESGKKMYVMLDPTYSQFALPANLYPAFGLSEIQAKKSPFDFLMRTEEGIKLWNTLKQDGYFVITDETAQSYIESLCPNLTMKPQDAFHSLTVPAYHTTNLKHGRNRLKQTGCLGINVQNILEETFSATKTPPYPALSFEKTRDICPMVR